MDEMPLAITSAEPLMRGSPFRCVEDGLYRKVAHLVFQALVVRIRALSYELALLQALHRRHTTRVWHIAHTHPPMSIRLHHELGECTVAVDTTQPLPAALAEMHAASGHPRAVEEYVFEYVDGYGEMRVLGEESGTLGEAGIVGCGEVVDMRLQGKYAARAQLAACGVDVYGWVGAEGDSGAEAQVREAAKRAIAAGRSGRESLQLLALAEVPYRGFVAGVAGRALAEQLARTGLGGGAAELFECCKEMGSENDAMGRALLYAATVIDDMSAMSRAERVEAMVAEGAPLDFKDEKGNTALIWACRTGHTDVAEALISMGAALDVQGEDGSTALLWACREMSSGIVEPLISMGAALDVQGKDGDTALIWALRNCLTEPALALIRHDAALDVEGDYGDTALLIAVRSGFGDEVAEPMMRRGSFLDENSRSFQRLPERTKVLYQELRRALHASEVREEEDA